VKVYHVEYANKRGDKWEPHVIVIRDPSEAEAAAKIRRDDPTYYACVKVTGPFDHEVPND
jgi:hypothetical protein